MQRKHSQDKLTSFGIKSLMIVAAIGLANPCRATMIDLTPTNGVNSSTSVSLADLVSGQVMGVTVGDKIFTGFNYSHLGDMPPAQDVLILGFKDQDGNWGVSAHGSFFDLPGDATPSTAQLRFMVQVDPTGTAAGLRISDAHLFLGGAGTDANSQFTVDETFLESNQTLHTVSQGGLLVSSDSVVFNPTLLKINVTKSIFALAARGGFLPARATVIDQSFSQRKVPEPTTIVLSSIAALAFAVFRRCHTTANQ
jgi:hypothetical protein